jgi:hypothetical protein
MPFNAMVRTPEKLKISQVENITIIGLYAFMGETSPKTWLKKRIHAGLPLDGPVLGIAGPAYLGKNSKKRRVGRFQLCSRLSESGFNM